MNNDFTIKGFHVDLRIQAMPMAALRRLADDLAAVGLNTLLMEWEATYPYDKHAVISNAHAYTREEITAFIAYCARLGIQVIPLQQSFGHVEYILRHERYEHLGESAADRCQVCPCQKNAAYELFRELLADMATLHPSKYMHIGGDEVYLLGQCPRCRAKTERVGKSKLYVDYLKGVAQEVVKLGRRPLIWADMMLKYPEAANALPRECVLVDWNYGWRTDQFGDVSKLRSAGFEIWGAAALRSGPDNHSLTCWGRHLENIREFIPYARHEAYTGMLLTSWSTSGVYGYEWDQKSEVVEMYPVRRVYPLSGFRILLAAYSESLKRDEPINPMDFVRQYAIERFGLTSREGTKLWHALTSDATILRNGVDINAVHAGALRARRLLSFLHPRKHGGEFGHFLMMADLREFHVRFKKLESEIQSPCFSSAQIPQKIRALARLIEESEALDERYIEANKDFVYYQALLEDVEARSKKLRKLYDRLTRAGRKPCQGRGSARQAERKLRWPGEAVRPTEKALQDRSPLVAAE